MKKLFSAMTFIALVGLFSLASCEKDMIPQTTQGLMVRHYENNYSRALIAVGEKGISTGPGFTLMLETYEHVIHVKSITVDIISNSPEPITAISLNVQNNWAPNSAIKKSVKNKTVTLTGDFIITPGRGETQMELIPSYAGIGKNSIAGEKIEIRVTKIVYLSEKDNRTGELNPEIKALLGTTVASAPQIYPSVWSPFSQSRLYLPRTTGKTDIAVIILQVTEGSCTFKKVKMILDLEGMFLSASREVTIRDAYSGAVTKTKVLSTSGGEFFLDVPTPIGGQNAARYLIVSVDIESIMWGVPQSITTKNISFEWSDHIAGGKEYSTDNHSMMWYGNGYNSLAENYIKLDW